MVVTKPQGLTLLAAGEGVAGVVTLLSAVTYLQEIYSFTSSLGLQPSQFPDFYAYFGALAAVSAAALFIAYGLWRGRKWGFTVGNYFSVAYLVFCIGFGSYFVATYGDYTEIEAGVLYLVMSGAVLLYLGRPQVKDFFEGVKEEPDPPAEPAL